MNRLRTILLVFATLSLGGATLSQTTTGTLVSAYLGTATSANTVSSGSTLQFTAYGVYSDGSVAALPDGHGNAVTAWSSTSPQVGSISTTGLFTALTPGTTSIWAKIGTLTASPWGMTVTTGPSAAAPSPQGSPIGDAFFGPFWRLLNPVGGTATISNGHLFLNVPGGSNHDTVSPVNNAVRAMQAIGNYNFDVAIKIDSPIVASNKGAKEGLMVVFDPAHLITFGLAADGTNLHLTAEAVTSGSMTVLSDITHVSQSHSSMYLRLSRTGTYYVAYYSLDGTSWVRAGSFTNNRTPTSIGPFGSNYNTSPAAASPVTVSVNWFHAA
jgi:hypothetical protein